MTLQTIAKCVKINKKSSSPAFKNMEVGDKILFSCPIEAAGYRRGTYSTYILCRNERTGEESNLSFNQIPRVLQNFEFEELLRL